MMSEQDFLATVEALVLQGYTRDQAARYAACLGDIIEEAPDGRWIIRDTDGSVLALIQPLE